MDCSPPGSSVHGIFPRILEWVAISCSRGSSQPRDRTHISCTGRWIHYHWATWEVPLHWKINLDEIHWLYNDLCSHEIYRNKQLSPISFFLFDVSVRYSLRKCTRCDITLIIGWEGRFPFIALGFHAMRLFCLFQWITFWHPRKSRNKCITNVTVAQNITLVPYDQFYSSEHQTKSCYCDVSCDLIP